MTNKKKLSKETGILKLLLIVNLFFVVVELGMSIITGSQAILMDAIFDGSELLVTMIAIKLIPLVYKPETEKRPYGYSQVETLLVMIKGFMMTVVTVGIIANGINLMISGGNNIDHGLVAVFEIFSAVLVVLVICVMEKANKHVDSPTISTEIKGMKMDAIISLGLGFAFLLPVIFRGEYIDSISPYLDQVVSVCLAMFMLPVPLKTIRMALRDIFLFAPEEDVIEHIKSVSEPILDDNHIESVMYDIVKTGRKVWVSIYFKPRQNYISIANMKKLQDELKVTIEEEISDVYIELIPDIN